MGFLVFAVAAASAGAAVMRNGASEQVGAECVTPYGHGKVVELRAQHDQVVVELTGWRATVYLNKKDVQMIRRSILATAMEHGRKGTSTVSSALGALVEDVQSEMDAAVNENETLRAMVHFRAPCPMQSSHTAATDNRDTLLAPESNDIPPVFQESEALVGTSQSKEEETMDCVIVSSAPETTVQLDELHTKYQLALAQLEQERAITRRQRDQIQRLEELLDETHTGSTVRPPCWRRRHGKRVLLE